LRRRARLLHQQIAATQRLVTEAGAAESVLHEACAPYYRLLDQLYLEDMPVARALDNSDLLLHLDGEGLQTRRPRLSLVTGIISDVRKQVGAMIKTLVSSINEAVELPREIEMGLSSFALGSLYLGFSLPEPGPGYMVIEGDPLFSAAREALTTLGAVTDQLNKPDAYARIRHQFADPKVRDAALSAVGHLAPTGRRGVSSIELSGRALPGGAWRRLTPETREQVRAWLDEPVVSRESIEVRGHVRAVDLDVRRFDLRRVGENLPDLRCIYPTELDAQAKDWLDATVIVRGQAELYHGAPRLVQVNRVEQVSGEAWGP
jgi:hypothetical protein